MRSETVAQDASLTKALRHLEVCDVCRGEARLNQAATRMLNELKARDLAAPRADCPSVSEWTLLVTGQVESAKAGDYLQHAADCDHCGTLLKEATSDDSDEFSTDEQTMISQLKSSDPAWQKRFARELAAKSHAQVDPTSRGPAKVLRRLCRVRESRPPPADARMPPRPVRE